MADDDAMAIYMQSTSLNALLDPAAEVLQVQFLPANELTGTRMLSGVRG